MKLTFVAATLAGMSVGANATTTDLGTVTTAPITFSGSVLGSGVTFSDIFTFNGSQSAADELLGRRCSTKRGRNKLSTVYSRACPFFRLGPTGLLAGVMTRYCDQVQVQTVILLP